MTVTEKKWLLAYSAITFKLFNAGHFKTFPTHQEVQLFYPMIQFSLFNIVCSSVIVEK